MAAPGPPPSVLLEGNAAAIVFGAVSFLQRPLLRWERQRMFFLLEQLWQLQKNSNRVGNSGVEEGKNPRTEKG